MFVAYTFTPLLVVPSNSMNQFDPGHQNKRRGLNHHILSHAYIGTQCLHLELKREANVLLIAVD